MKRRIVVAGVCVSAWLCGSVPGQTTVVTNLLVMGTQRQGTNAAAVGVQSTAQGNGSMAIGSFSHAEGDTAMATGTASHAEGALTIAGGDQSHAEGLATEAQANNSHAGGAYARVRQQDTNSFIHATGTSTNNMKQTQFPNTAHFDHLVTLAPALDASNAILSRAENDERYLVMTNGWMRGDLNMDEGSVLNVATLQWYGNGIDIEAHESTSNSVWGNWNADMLDGCHASAFATTQQMAQKLSITGGVFNTAFKMTVGDSTQLGLGEGGTVDLIGGEESVSEDNMHIKMRWDVSGDPSDPCIDLKTYGGASLRGLGVGSDLWWTDGRFCATNSGKTSEFFAVKAMDAITASTVKNTGPLTLYSGDENQSSGFWIGSSLIEIQGDLWCDGGDGVSFHLHNDTGNLDLGYDLSVGGEATIGSSTNQTNLTVTGWAKIDYIPPQGGISMGVYTNR